jgi:hypothetical protein
MRTETGTFELRDNDMMMRELTYAETSEVVGGEGVASVALPQCFLGSILGSPGLLTVLGSPGLLIVLATTGTSAFASISASGASLAAIAAAGGTVSASAQVF